MEDVKVTVYDGSYHEVDSSEMAFKLAASMGFKEGARKAGAVILEPMMKVEVETPEDYMGDVIGDLNKRRGQVNSMDERGGNKIITAFCPLAEMFDIQLILEVKLKVVRLILWNLIIMMKFLKRCG